MRTRLFALGLTAAILTTLLSAPQARAAEPYADTVTADSPSIWYRFNETAGTTIADSSGSGRVGSTNRYSGSFPNVALGQSAGPTEPGGNSIGFADCNWGATNSTLTAPDTFSQEIWFKTSSTLGGALVGFGTSNTSLSGGYDRRLFMVPDGRVGFGVVPPNTLQIVMSTGSYNDGNWHQAVTTLGAAGMHLYVDGAVVATNPSVTSGQPMTAYWRVGCDNAGLWPYSHGGIDGLLDDASLYVGTQLSAARVLAHYSAGRALATGVVVTAAVNPSMSFTVSGRSSACNTETRTGSATGSTLSLGRLTPAAPGSAAQDLNATTNAASGWKMLMRTYGPPTDTRGNTIPFTSVGGPAAFPSAGTAAFAVTFDWMSAGTWFQPGNFPSEFNNMAGPGVGIPRCVAFQAQVASTTPAGDYSTTVVYTLVPRF